MPWSFCQSTLILKLSRGLQELLHKHKHRYSWNELIINNERHAYHSKTSKGFRSCVPETQDKDQIYISHCTISWWRTKRLTTSFKATWLPSVMLIQSASRGSTLSPMKIVYNFNTFYTNLIFMYFNPFVTHVSSCCAKLIQSCLTLCHPMYCRPPGSPVYGFSRQEYWSGLLFSSPGELPHPGMEPEALTSPALAGGFFTISATWIAPLWLILFTKCCKLLFFIWYMIFFIYTLTYKSHRTFHFT